MDLDNFEQIIKLMEWNEHSPNPITALLTDLIEQLVRGSLAL